MHTDNSLTNKIGFAVKKQKGNRQTMSVPQMWRIWGKNSALAPNPFPQKGGEKVL